MKRRKSMSFDESDLKFYDEYARRKGILGGFPGLVSVALHAYVARNKARGLTPPWEGKEAENGAENGPAGNETSNPLDRLSHRAKSAYEPIHNESRRYENEGISQNHVEL